VKSPRWRSWLWPPGYARTLAPDRQRATLAVVAAAIALAVPSAWGQIGAIVVGAAVGLAVLREAPPAERSD